jgi:two-component system, chemotaxis family, sensor kinase CheA
LRNAVDHGLEPPAERAAQGKPEHGRLELATRVDGEEFVIEVTDDGRGINWPKLGLRAQAAGLPYETRADLEAALFHDGVSTADEVTELSGRGVGLAAVKEAVLALNGRIAVQSHPHKGATFIFRFPKETMAKSADELMVDSDVKQVAVA